MPTPSIFRGVAGFPVASNSSFFPFSLPLLALHSFAPIDLSAALPAAEGRKRYGWCPINGEFKDWVEIKRRPISRGEEDAMLGAVAAVRLDKTLWLRGSRSLGGTGCYRPAFESLSHGGSRSFQHKTGPAPQSCSVLENFRAATTCNLSTARHPPYYRYSSALISLQLRTASASRNGYRFYSRSSTLPTMAEVEWTGPRVRKTFLDYFAERGHSIGKAPPPDPLQHACQKTSFFWITVSNEHAHRWYSNM
jgi:hypothetical protein